ncbi:MAG: hypothetical protein HYZ81_24605, partial [Nitrospinae bacterium]|nr:hypothetical protein [Nitrospinota bacterium]
SAPGDGGHARADAAGAGGSVGGADGPRPLVLVLEDLHWSDAATLDLVAWLARRREPARLLLLGTYRPAEVIVHSHPLRAVTQDLSLHGLCEELRLESLHEAAVAEYLAARFPEHGFPPALSRALHRRTDGQPLFIVAVVDEMLRQGWVAEGEGRWQVTAGVGEVEALVPESLREFIEQQLDGLGAEDQRVLEAASVAGVEFSAAVVAAVVGRESLQVEERCAGLVRQRQVLEASGMAEWPDGTVAECYRFRHALYQQIVYDRLPGGRRVQFHHTIGVREEVGYGAQAGEHAAELAVHFDRGRDYPRAVRYRQRAAANALQRWAYREAIGSLTRGLELLEQWPAGAERTQRELDLQMALAPALMATKGLSAPEVEQTYARARALCQQVGETPQLFPTLWGLSRFYLNRGMLPTARELAEQLYQLAEREAAPTQLLEAHDALGFALLYQGEYAAAWTHIQQGIALTDPTAQRALALLRGTAPGVRCLAGASNTLWCLGYPSQAVRRSQEALALAQEIEHPHSLALAQVFAAFLHYRRREAPAVQAQAEALLTLATAQGFPLWVGYGTFQRGWALAMQGQSEAGMMQLRQGTAAVLAMGQMLVQPRCLVMLAEAAGHSGHVEEGLRWLAESLAAFAASRQGEMLTEAYRLQGELLLTSNVQRQEEGAQYGSTSE